MHMTRQDLPATKSGTDLLAMLTRATQEGKAATADLCSTRLDKLATFAANEGLSAAEIVELIREEAASQKVAKELILKSPLSSAVKAIV